MKDKLAKFVSDPLFKVTNFDIKRLSIRSFQDAEHNHTPLLATSVFIYREVHHTNNMTEEAFIIDVIGCVVSTKGKENSEV